MQRPKYTSSSLISLNLNDSQTFKSSSCKNGSLQCVCYRCNLLRWILFIPWKTLFFLRVCRYCEIFSNVILSFSLKQVRILCYLHNNSVVIKLMLMLSSEKSYPILYLYLLEKLSYIVGFFYDNVFYNLYLFNFSTLSFKKLFFFFLKNSKHIWKHVFT